MLLGREGLETVTAVMWYIGMVSKRVKKDPLTKGMSTGRDRFSLTKHIIQNPDVLYEN